MDEAIVSTPNCDPKSPRDLLKFISHSRNAILWKNYFLIEDLLFYRRFWHGTFLFCNSLCLGRM